jgi:hypothetical protein
MEHTDVCLSACLALTGLATIPQNRTFLRSIANFYECIMTVMRKFIDNGAIVAACCLCIGSVCKEDVKHEAQDGFGTAGNFVITPNSMNG